MTLKLRYFTALLLGLTVIPLSAQVANSPVTFADVDAITTTFVDAPALGFNSGNGNGDTKWLKVEFRFNVTKDAGPYLDAVEFKIWIEGRDMLDPDAKPDTGVAIALTGSVTYVNIPQGKDNYGVFYVHPSTLKRYCKLSPTDFDRAFNIHIEANVGGKYADRFDKNKEDDPEWYQPPKLKAISGLVYRQNQCPFIVSDPNRYPVMKLPSEAGN